MLYPDMITLIPVEKTFHLLQENRLLTRGSVSFTDFNNYIYLVLIFLLHKKCAQ